MSYRADAHSRTQQRVVLSAVVPKHRAQRHDPSILDWPGAGPAGIGAGNGVDGQVLVLHDMLGMIQEFNPRFLRRYLNLSDDITSAVQNYVADVKSKDFPNEKEQY